jgi:hypothetical protein
MLSAILCLVVLQSVSFQSTSTDVVNVVNAKFSIVKAVNGSDLCAVSQPAQEVSTRSKTDCTRACLTHGKSCTHVNYRPNDKVCQLLYPCPPSPINYQVQPDSIHLQVICLT